ncbi:choice-of-anchor D domain-containing protein [bacterium]|nr:choice-of-anchor D domain-containing protein [bacterium]
MRKFQLIIFSSLLMSSVLQSQESHVTLLGRWGKGKSEAVFRRGEFTFTGNGAYLEVFKNRQGSYDILDIILLPGPVKDIWVDRDTTNIYVACGDEGLQVVYFNYQTHTFSGIIGALNTPGYAESLMLYGNHVYIADGYNGMVIANVQIPSNPQIRGTFSTDGVAHHVWALNDTIVLVAADSSGLYSVNTSDRYSPVQLDLLTFQAAFSEQLYPDRSYPVIYDVLAVDTTAYVATGWGGLRTINIKNPANLSQWGVWVDNFPVDMRGVWVTADNAFLACGDYGIYGPLDVSDPTHPKMYGFLPLDTEGFTSTIVVDGDTAYVGDGDNGHLLVDAREGFQPSLLDSFEAAGIAHDVAIDEVQGSTYGFIASGKSGIKVVDLDISSPPDYMIDEIGSYDTPGEARKIEKKGSWLYVADGSYGLTVLDAFVPTVLEFQDDFPTQGDTCYDVDESDGIIFLACGEDGLRLINFGATLSEVSGSPIITPGSARAIKIVDDMAYVALFNRVYIYDISELPNLTVVNSYTTSNIEAVGIDYLDNKVFIANGQFGFIVWDLSTGSAYSIETGHFCTDIVVKEKTIYVTDTKGGLRIFDFSKLNEILEVGYYNTGGRSKGLANSGDMICVADGENGLYVFESEIRPEIVVSPLELNFGPVAINKSRPINVWIQNTGTTLLKIEGIDYAAEYDVFEFDEVTFSVAPGETYKLIVRFEPFAGVAGLVVGSANIYSNAGTVNLGLQGKAISPITEDPYDRDDLTLILYHFDEVAGDTIIDASLYGLNGQLSGDPERIASKDANFNRALYFDGIDDHALIEYDDLLNFSDHAFTVELWFKMESKPSSYYILLKRGIGSTLQYELALASDSQPEKGVMASVQDATGTVHKLYTGSMAELSVGQWYHTALSWDMDSLRLYLNSVLRSKKELRANLIQETAEDLAIGASAYGNAPFHGTIDEVRISSVARQPWEFHVNRSNLVVDEEAVDFGSVLLGYSRAVPLIIKNGGSQTLMISEITTTNDLVVNTHASGLSLGENQDSTIWLTFKPVSAGALTQGSDLVISSSDPTFPEYHIPLVGEGVSSLPAGPYETDAFTLGLWHCDETSGSMVLDASGNHMDGTWNGAIRPSGKFNLSLWFDGENDFCTITPVAGQIIRSAFGGFTIEGWFYFEDVPQEQVTLMERRDASFSQFQLYVDQSAHIVCKMYNTSMVPFSVNSNSIGGIEENQWYHISGVVDQDSLYLYINGNQVDAVPFEGPLAGMERGTVVEDVPGYIGSDAAGNYPFYGKIDELRISDINRQVWEFNVEMARVEVSSTQMDFGSVLIGTARSLDLWVKNPGIDVLDVSSVYSSAPTLFSANTSGFSVLPGDRKLVEITYTPTDTVIQTGQITLETNDPFWHFRPVYLEGRGIEIEPGGSYESDLFTFGLFHFDQSTGTTANDSSDYGINGNLMGGASWSTNGRFGSCLLFNGINGRVEIPDVSSLYLDYADFTIELWFLMVEKPLTQYILSRRGNGNIGQFELVLDHSAGLIGRIWSEDSTAYTLSSGSMALLNTDQWYHAALSWDGDSLRLFLNNELRDVLAFTGSLLAMETDPLMIGADFLVNYPFYGSIDEFRLSQTARQSWEFNVLPPELVIQPSELNFATVYSGQSRTLRFSVTNQGDQDLVIHNIAGADGVFTLPDSLTSFILGRTQTKMIPVTYTPTGTNTTNRDLLTITSNDTQNPVVTIDLEGSVTDARSPWPYQEDYHTLTLFHFSTIDMIGDTLVMDVSEHGYHGLLRNGADITSNGYYGDALMFDGLNDFLEITSNADLVFDMEKESHSIEFLFRTDTLAQTLISKGFENNDQSIEYRISINRFGRLDVEGFGSGGPQVNDDSWHHLAFTYNHLTQMGILYLDGNQIWSRMRTVQGGISGDRPLLLGAAEEDLNRFEGYFIGMMDEFRISDIVREPWEFQLIDYGIEILSLSPVSPMYGEDLVFNFHVPVNLEASNVSIYYRSGGSGSYSTLSATGAGTTYQVTLPAEAITLRGLEYYVKIISSENTYTYPAMDPENNPLTEVVQHTGMEAPFTFPHRKFKMFSIPFLLDSTEVASIIEDDFGPYDPYQWRLFLWNRWDTVYVEYNNLTKEEFSIVPGSAFWMITDRARSFDIGGGETVTTDSSYRVYVGRGRRDFLDSLHIIPGWTMIGNPYNFTVQWDDCSLSSDSVTSLYYWDGETFQTDIAELEPWEGYFICNQGRKNAILSILPKESEGIGKKTINKGLLTDLQTNEWMYRISVSTDQMKDLYNYAGVRADARERWDHRDQPEPPPIGEYAVGYFKHADWDTHRGLYTSDIRHVGEVGYVWEFTVETQLLKTPVTVEWNLLHNLPEDWEAYIFDLSDGIAKSMLKQHSLNYETENEKPDKRLFKIVVGPQSYIENQSNGIPLEPVQFSLQQNYPNPFNPNTTIRYSLPKKSQVEISIFNAIGQRVRKLYIGTENAGHHEIEWDGKDDLGRSVSSGVYICRLKASEELIATRKMIILK